MFSLCCSFSRCSHFSNHLLLYIHREDDPNSEAGELQKSHQQQVPQGGCDVSWVPALPDPVLPQEKGASSLRIREWYHLIQSPEVPSRNPEAKRENLTPSITLHPGAYSDHANVFSQKSGWLHLGQLGEQLALGSLLPLLLSSQGSYLRDDWARLGWHLNGTASNCALSPHSFKTKLNKDVCADPQLKWVQDSMKLLDKKTQTPKPWMPTSQPKNLSLIYFLLTFPKCPPILFYCIFKEYELNLLVWNMMS